MVSQSEVELEIKPTVILMHRRPPTFEFTVNFDWYEIIDAALGSWKSLPIEEIIKHPYLQNVIIIDENEFWAVCFVSTGNGRIVTEETKGFFDLEDYIVLDNANEVVYLDKSSLAVVEPPKGAIIYLPYSLAYYLPEDSLFFKHKKELKNRLNREENNPTVEP